MLIAQISDLHIMRAGELSYGSIDSYASVSRCVRHIMLLERRPDAVLASGDLTHYGTHEEYGRLRELLASLAMPVYLIPGNHDNRGNLADSFPEHAYLPRGTDALCYAIDAHPVRFIGLDTIVPGAEGGTLGSRQSEWLEHTLSAAPAQPTIIFMHHPPIETGIRNMDEIALDAVGVETLFRIIARHSQLRRIVCGHVHRDIHAVLGTTPVSICPSAAYQARFTFSGKFEPAAGEPPAYHLHHWNGQELATHTIAVPA